MSRTKGLSFEEKCKRMTELFWERKEVFTLKELETLAPKAKGIVSQSVKDVLTTCVAEGTVDTDKIGSGNFYWSFPSKTLRTKQIKYQQLTQQQQQLTKELETLNEQLIVLEASRTTSDARSEQLQQLEVLQQQVKELTAASNEYMDCDMDAINKLKKGQQVSRDAANRWTDNIYVLVSYMKNKTGNPEMTNEKILQYFDLPKDMDQLE
jgi:hypothetical protein